MKVAYIQYPHTVTLSRLMKTVVSKNNVRIRLETERWMHIVEAHNDIAGMLELVMETVSEPDRIIEGWEGELLAVRIIERGKALIVVYRETGVHDGFIITAYATKRLAWFKKRRIIWQKQQ